MGKYCGYRIISQETGNILCVNTINPPLGRISQCSHLDDAENCQLLNDKEESEANARAELLRDMEENPQRYMK